MKIGGLQKISLIDFPGKVSSVIFTQGCNFRCPYCHNSELVLPEKFCDPIPETEILKFLDDRKGKIQGIVITGGEPTLQADLICFISKVKKMGFLVKLDTNGSCPEVIASVIDLKLVDYIAMDIKAPFGKYSLVTGLEGLEDKVKQSIELIMNSGIEYEFRTTLAKSLVSVEDVYEISEIIKGAKKYKLQKFVQRNTNLQEALGSHPDDTFSDEEFENLQKECQVGI